MRENYNIPPNHAEHMNKQGNWKLPDNSLCRDKSRTSFVCNRRNKCPQHHSNSQVGKKLLQGRFEYLTENHPDSGDHHPHANGKPKRTEG
ncbi:protein of unknown function [Cupriavidus taiwanensis]|nr:protein of unknown function [Cupriavidus taiwanensis]